MYTSNICDRTIYISQKYLYKQYQKDFQRKQIKVALVDDYSDILINDLEKRLGTLDKLKYLKGTQIRDLIKTNYKFINAETLSFAVLKIKIQELDDDGNDDISRYKPEEKRINFVEIVINALTETKFVDTLKT